MDTTKVYLPVGTLDAYVGNEYARDHDYFERKPFRDDLFVDVDVMGEGKTAEEAVANFLRTLDRLVEVKVP